MGWFWEASMRGFSRVVLVVIFLLAVSVPLSASHLQGDCPLTLVGHNPATSDFGLSPHGVFRANGFVYVLRGQNLTTYTVTELGDLQVAREDFIGSMAARESNGGVVFHNGHLFVSSEAGLEIFNLTNVRPGGSAPTRVARIPGLHYRRLAASGNTLAGLFPISDFPCYPRFSAFCFNQIDLFNISTLSAPIGVGTISSLGSQSFLGWNDIAFNQGFLFAAGEGGTVGFNVSNPGTPISLGQIATRGTFLISNGTNLLGIGNEGSIEVFTVGLNGGITRFAIYNLAPGETIDRANDLMFHPQGFFDEQNGRLITMIDEIDPMTLRPARTIAFDIFDMTVPQYEGAYQRGYENISYVQPDEVKFNPIAVGSFIYTVGSMSGLETWGACGITAGGIDYNGTQAFNCGGTSLHGWVTGDQRIANVEVFLDNGSLGPATLSGLRTDISSRTPVQSWTITVNLDQTARGEHTIRAVATDATGRRRQFASQRVFFAGPGNNCVNRRRVGGR